MAEEGSQFDQGALAALQIHRLGQSLLSESKTDAANCDRSVCSPAFCHLFLELICISRLTPQKLPESCWELLLQHDMRHG